MSHCCFRHGGCAGGSGGARCLSLAHYVTEMGPMDGATAAGGRSCCLSSRRCPQSFPFGLSDLSWLAQGKSPAFEGARLGVFDRGSLPPFLVNLSIVQDARRGVRRRLRPRPPSRAEVGSSRHDVSPLPARKRGGCEVLRGVRRASCQDLRQLRPAAQPDGKVLS
jgi:hypothetical protein